MDVYYEYVNERSNLTTTLPYLVILVVQQHRVLMIYSMPKSFSRYASASNIGGLMEILIVTQKSLYIPWMLAKSSLTYQVGGTSKFPTFGRMARDILAIPVSAVPLDSSFSTMMTNPNCTGLGPNSQKLLSTARTGWRHLNEVCRI